MLIRRNTKEFKGIQNILESYADSPSRKKQVRLFIVKAGEKLDNRISIDELGNEAFFYYDINYATILSSLYNNDHRLYRSEEVKGLYYFKNPHFPAWDQTPFQLPKTLIEKIDEFAKKPKPKKGAQRAAADLPEDEAVFAEDSQRSRKKTVKAKASSHKTTKPKKEKAPEKEEAPKPKELVLGEKHKLHFTGVERVIFPQGNITLEEVLGYYDNISGYVLPYLLDRPQSLHLHRKEDAFVRSIERLREHSKEHLPKWVKQVKDIAKTDGKQRHYFVCKDKDHLFFLLHMGCIELHPWLVKMDDLKHPDHFAISLRNFSDDYNNVIEVAQAIHDILEPAFDSYIKLGPLGFHIYVPWREKTGLRTSEEVSKLVTCQAAMLTKKISTIHRDEARKQGKVHIEFSMNKAAGSLLAPYSVIQDSRSGCVAAPLSWDEVKKGLDPESFNLRTMSKRVERSGDIWKGFSDNGE
jgi:DNA primase